MCNTDSFCSLLHMTCIFHYYYWNPLRMKAFLYICYWDTIISTWAVLRYSTLVILATYFFYKENRSNQKL